MQGEAGIKIPPKGYLAKVSKICQKNHVLLLLDEVQTGLGRTGKMFAFEHEHIKPDGLILGKALGGGVLPVSAFLAKKEVLSLFTPGTHGSTFGGNPLAASVASEALDVLQEEKLVENSKELGSYFLKELQKIKSPMICDIRGIGLWIGIDIDPKKAKARVLCEKLMQKGILAKETHETVIRLAPPLVITKAEIDWALEQITNLFNS
jgi:ornithine--oxo-acid transaminase